MNCAKGWVIVMASVITAVSTEIAFAADFSTNTLLRLDDKDTGFYHGHAFSLDSFGFGATRDKGGADDLAWGPGGGANYFITKTLGVGSADAFEVPYMVNGSGFLRHPFEETGFAAYGFGGLGRQWKYSPQWLGHIGIGSEYRCTWGAYVSSVFVDIREEFPTETKEYTVFRFGFRLRFK